MRAQNNPSDRLKAMCDRVNELYQGVEQSCLFGVLLLGEARGLFHEKINNSLKLWIEAIAEVLVAAGIEEKIAREQAEDAIASIQGALILARGLVGGNAASQAAYSTPSVSHNLEPFQRTLRQIKNLIPPIN